MLVDGRWSATWQPVQGTDAKGGFVRAAATFRGQVTPDGSPGTDGRPFAAVAGRYHLFVTLICPWASRTLIARRLKKLEDVVGVTVLDPVLSDQGWRFDPADGPEAGIGTVYLHELYTRADPSFSGRATVPVLWDKVTGTIVNNESADIVRIFNDGFGTLVDPSADLYPVPLRAEIDAWNSRIYPSLNNGVYRAGFATTQVAYEEAVREVFDMLDTLDVHLRGRRFLVGECLTEADIRLFVTLVRFDLAYHGLFKCNLRRIADYPALTAYLQRLLAFPAFAECTDVAHIKRGYYSIKALNPTGIVPLGPANVPGLDPGPPRENRGACREVVRAKA